MADGGEFADFLVQYLTEEVIVNVHYLFVYMCIFEIDFTVKLFLKKGRQRRSGSSNGNGTGRSQNRIRKGLGQGKVTKES